MGRQELRRLAARLCHVLPELDALARIKTGLRHQVQPDQVGLGFVRSAEWQNHAILHTEAEPGEYQRLLVVAGAARTQRNRRNRHARLCRQLFRDAFVAVLGQHVREFMPHDGSDLVLVDRVFQQPLVDTDLVAGQRKCVRLVVREHAHLPRCRIIVFFELWNDRVRNALHIIARAGIAGLGRILLDLLEALHAHAVDLVLGQQLELAASLG